MVPHPGINGPENFGGSKTKAYVNVNVNINVNVDDESNESYPDSGLSKERPHGVKRDFPDNRVSNDKTLKQNTREHTPKGKTSLEMGTFDPRSDRFSLLIKDPNLFDNVEILKKHVSELKVERKNTVVNLSSRKLTKPEETLL